MSLSNLANALGIAGQSIDINPGSLNGYVEREDTKFREPDLESTPLVAAGRATIGAQLAQRRVLDKQIYPTFHWLFGMQLRGSGLDIHAQDQSGNVFGLIPCIPNYQAAMIMNWNFLDFARLHQEKKIQDKRIRQSHLDLDLVRNNLKTEDFQTRAQLEASYEIVENTRVQLQAAEMALKQSQARYDNGLSSVVALAESSQVMEQARLEEAQAHVGIWKVLLSMAALRGDLKPFLSLTQKIDGRP
jgi:outer membrane protein TolC